MPILVTCECGKQFQAKDENVGRRFACPNCGRDVLVAKPELDPYHEPRILDEVESKTSGKAIASLVLGLASFLPICLFFAGLPAIILGAMGLSDIGGSRGRLRGKGMAITGIVTGVIGSLLMGVAVLAALLIPAVQAARQAAQRAQCINNLKQIGLAFSNYNSAEGRLPAASICNAEGKALLSWRVTILPYLEQAALYKQFKLDEPWDSPTNRALIPLMPLTYRCPSDNQMGSTSTRYQVIVGPGGLFDGTAGTTIDTITDGTSNTLMVVEAQVLVEWTKPDDVDIAGVATGLGSLHPGVNNALFVDGSVKAIKTKIVSPTVIKALTTKNGGEVISADSY